MADWQRTHTCGELREEHIDQTVTLNGWVHTYRDHAHNVFIDLRDRFGLTQIVFDPDGGEEFFKQAEEIRSEWVLSVTGKVVKRIAGRENPKLPTGQIEVQVETLRVLNTCPTPPFEVAELPGSELANEDIRLQYRYLDLRRGSLQAMLILRNRLNKAIRDYLDGRGFIDVETPLLGRSTPEGARDYLVPSRLFEEQFYALPQSPQIYKQLLMVSGFDKYYQIARCLRDEDLRADRQPEFTQLDMEMSFVEVDDVLGLIEGLVVDVFRKLKDVDLPTPFQRLPYDEAMLKYGSDKPDLRFGLEIQDVTDLAGRTEFKVFKDVVAAGNVVRGINAKGAAAKFSNTELKPGGVLPKFVAEFGAKGLAWLKAENGDKFVSSIEKFFPADVQAELRERFAVEPGDLLLFIADTEKVAGQALGHLRNHLAEKLGLIEEGTFKVAWVIDFPSFIYDDDEGRYVANHHPFTAPRDEDLDMLEGDPGKVRAKAYDLVANGYELGGGSVRIHSQEVQARMFRALGIDDKVAKDRFGFLLDALKYGAPPHGGIAFGLDRWCMILGGTDNIRDVIAFPKNQKARDLMTGAPGDVDARQLKELGLKE